RAPGGRCDSVVSVSGNVSSRRAGVPGPGRPRARPPRPRLPGRHMSVTIKDVARRAGVSVATVSRALNGSGPVREETRRRIEQVARDLNYTPNSAARSLISRRTGMFGVLLPDLFGEFFSELIRGIDGAA